MSYATTRRDREHEIVYGFKKSLNNYLDAMELLTRSERRRVSNKSTVKLPAMDLKTARAFVSLYTDNPHALLLLANKMAYIPQMELLRLAQTAEWQSVPYSMAVSIRGWCYVWALALSRRGKEVTLRGRYVKRKT
jgi:hypothetical protein